METFVELLMLKEEAYEFRGVFRWSELPPPVLHIALRSSSFRPSVVCPLTFYILIFFLRTTEHNLTKPGMNDP
jgi:hypothetical protein